MRCHAIAAIRYDLNVYMLIEVERERNTWRILNECLVEWSTHYSKSHIHV